MIGGFRCSAVHSGEDVDVAIGHLADVGEGFVGVAVDAGFGVGGERIDFRKDLSNNPF